MRIADASRTMADIRSRMEEDEQLSVLMAGLRGANMNASDFADKDVVMQVFKRATAPESCVLFDPTEHAPQSPHALDANVGREALRQIPRLVSVARS